MKDWKLVVVLLLGASFNWVTESPAGCRSRQKSDPLSSSQVSGRPAAKETVDLRWKFEANKPFYVEITTKTDQTMKVGEMDVIGKQHQSTFLRVAPEKKDEKGNWILVMKFVGFRLSSDIGGNKMELNTRRLGPGHELYLLFDRLQAMEFKVILGRNWAVSKVEVDALQEIIREYCKTNPKMGPLLQIVFSENAIKKMFEPIFFPIPQRPVGKGETWKWVSVLDPGPLGSFMATSKYSYEGKKETQHRIKVEGRVSYSPPKQGGKNLPFQIVGGSLVGPHQGEILFHSSRGRLVRGFIQGKLKGTLNIDIGGVETVVELRQFQTLTVTVTDKNPLSKREKSVNRHSP